MHFIESCYTKSIQIHPNSIKLIFKLMQIGSKWTKSKCMFLCSVAVVHAQPESGNAPCCGAIGEWSTSLCEGNRDGRAREPCLDSWFTLWWVPWTEPRTSQGHPFLPGYPLCESPQARHSKVGYQSGHAQWFCSVATPRSLWLLPHLQQWFSLISNVLNIF